MKKNLFAFDFNNFSSSSGSYSSQETCEPCSLECEKMNININGRKLSDIKKEELTKALSPFKY